MRKIISRFKGKKEKNNPDSSSYTSLTILSSSARVQTPASRSVSPHPPTNAEIHLAAKGDSTPEITDHLDTTKSRSVTTTEPEEPVVPPTVVLQSPLQQPADTQLLVNEESASDARLTEVSARNEQNQPPLNNKVVKSRSHTALEPSGQRNSLTGSQEAFTPPTAAPSVVSISESQLHAGGDIYNVVGSLEVNNDTTTRKLKTILNPVNAAWDSYEADQRSKCSQNTRQQLLDGIETWIRGSDSHAPIFVLDGVAGIGKSTVAQTVAERAAEAGILGASFYFTRNEVERMVAKHFFPTIAFQLARYREAFAQRIAEALETDPDAPQKTIQQQLSLLIINPLRDLLVESGPQILIVIDALDECKEDEAEILLTLLAHHAPRLPRIKIFLTTRPEWPIRNVLSQDRNHALFHLHEIEDSIVQSDIQLYLNYCLSAQQVQRLFPHRQPPWQPSTEDKTMLCGICGTLFIIASTATKFILDTKAANPEKRLARLLEGVSSTDFSGSKRTDVMDRFYIQIIHQAAPDDADADEIDEWFDQYRIIIGAMIVLQYPLPCQALAQLLGRDSADIIEALQHLHSLLAPSGTDMIFRIHHKSFPDFITSLNRIERALNTLPTIRSNMTQQFLIDTRLHHHQLAAACFNVMDKYLKFNIGNTSPDLWFMDKADTDSHQDQSFKEELIYAASHWASHVHAAGELNSMLQDQFRTWAFTHIMAWIEVMSILGQIRRAHDMLDTALDAINLHPHDWMEKNTVHTILSDTRRFLLQSAEIATLAPMHIYWSALPFLPRNTLLYKTYYEKSKSLRAVSGMEEEWDPAALVTMTGHLSYVNAVVFAPDGKGIASASHDHTVRLWDGNTGAHLITLKGHSDWVYDAAFSPDSARVASASHDRTIRLWDVTTGAHLTILEGHSDTVRSVAFSPDGSRLASGSNDRSIRLWDAETGAHLITIEGHSDSVNSVTFSPDGLRFASASNDQTVCLWDGQTGARTIAFKGHSGGVRSVAFSPDGSGLASASNDHSICLWQVTTGAHTFTLEGHSSAVYSVVFSPDGLRLASGSADHTVRLWHATTGDPIITFSGYLSSVHSVTFAPDGSRLALGSFDYTVRLWNLSVDNPKGLSNCAGLPSEASEKLDPLPSGIDTIHAHSDEVIAMAYSPNGSRFASASDDKTLRLWERTSGAHITTLRGHSYSVRAVAFSPDGSRFASGSSDTTIRLWDGQTGAHLCTLDGHPDWVRAIVFSPDGSKLASISWDATVRLWDGRTGNPIAVLCGQSARLRAIAFSPDGLRLVSASDDRTFRVWDAQSGSHISSIRSDRIMESIAFSPGGSTFASASIRPHYSKNDMIALVYLRTINNDVCPIPLSRYFKSILSFTFLPSTQHSTSLPAITNTDDVSDPLFAHPITPDYPLRIIVLGQRKLPSLTGFVYLKVPADGEPVIVPFCWFPPHIHVTAFSVDPNGLSIAVGCKDGRVLLLDISGVSLP